MTPSPFQAAILAAEATTSDNLLIEACAGSGKTTTLKLLCEQIPRSKRTLALAFNKSTAETFCSKLPAYITSCTMHSCGLTMLRGRWSTIKMDKEKLEDHAGILAETTKYEWMTDDVPEVNPYEGPLSAHGAPRTVLSPRDRVLKLVDLAQNHCLDPTDHPQWAARATANGLDVFDPELSMFPDVLCEAAEVLLQRSRADVARCSYNDMLDFVVHYQLTGTRYDVILGDEVQDWNPLQLAFMQQMLVPLARPDLSALDDLMASLGSAMPTVAVSAESTTRVIFVGDRNQSLYLFRGADPRAMDKLKAAFDMRELPLSVSYRCPTSVVAEAQKIVGRNRIQAREGAPEGLVEHRQYAAMRATIEALGPDDMVVCRTNAPLVTMAIRMLIAGKKSRIAGRADGIDKVMLGYIASARKAGGDTQEGFFRALTRICSKVIHKAEVRGSTNKAYDTVEIHECICQVYEAIGSVSGIVTHINAVFRQTGGTQLSSVHRAKGEEADLVVLIEPHLIPHPMASRATNWEDAMQQEANCMYVAVTRAKSHLIIQAGRTGGSSSKARVAGAIGIASLLSGRLFPEESM